MVRIKEKDKSKKQKKGVFKKKTPFINFRFIYFTTLNFFPTIKAWLDTLRK